MLLSCVYFFWVSWQNVFGMIVTETEHFFFFFSDMHGSSR